MGGLRPLHGEADAAAPLLASDEQLFAKTSRLGLGTWGKSWISPRIAESMNALQFFLDSSQSRGSLHQLSASLEVMGGGHRQSNSIKYARKEAVGLIYPSLAPNFGF